MKKLILLSIILLVTACKGIVAGEMSEKRKRLYEIGNEENYCDKNPDRCIKGVAW